MKLERCKRYCSRSYLAIFTIILAILAIYFLYTNESHEPNIDHLNWKSHWSNNQESNVAKKIIFEQQGIEVQTIEESFEQYSQKLPNNDDSDYYDPDIPSLNKSSNLRDYEQKYQNDIFHGINNIQKSGAMGSVPMIKDYSKKLEFKNIFKTQIKENIDFLFNYKNPCWCESIPKFPYINNSYLNIPDHFRALDPQFKTLRNIYASRQDPSTKWRTRCLPYYYLMETPPFASPSLYTLLGYHPRIVNPVIDEPEFWNEKGPDQIASFSDYIDLFDGPAEQIRKNFTVFNIENSDEETIEKHKDITGDGTSSYLWSFKSWQRVQENFGSNEPILTVPEIIKRMTPNVKIIMMIRNPTDRLFEGYLSKTDINIASAADFHYKSAQSIKLMSLCIKKKSLRECLYDENFNKILPIRLRIGMYYTFINDWIKSFSRNQILVIRYEDYIKEPSLIINEVCNHLEIEPYPTRDLERLEKKMRITSKKNSRKKIKMLSLTRSMLNDLFKILNNELANLLSDQKFNWQDIDEQSDNEQIDQLKEVDIYNAYNDIYKRFQQLQNETLLLRKDLEIEKKQLLDSNSYILNQLKKQKENGENNLKNLFNKGDINQEQNKYQDKKNSELQLVSNINYNNSKILINFNISAPFFSTLSTSNTINNLIYNKTATNNLRNNILNNNFTAILKNVGNQREINKTKPYKINNMEIQQQKLNIPINKIAFNNLNILHSQNHANNISKINY